MISDPLVLNASKEAQLTTNVRKLEAEFVAEETEREIADLTALGDELAENKDYERAIQAYEQVFLLSPQHVQASAKIDALKKQLLIEGRHEVKLVSGIYNEEIEQRIKTYWQEVQRAIRENKIGRARYQLQKILLLDPLNEEAQALYGEIETIYEA